MKYWKTYPKERRDTLALQLRIYSAEPGLLALSRRLERSPHTVHKEREGKVIEFQEFFITDIVEFMRGDGLKVGYVVAENEDEIMAWTISLPSRKHRSYSKRLPSILAVEVPEERGKPPQGGLWRVRNRKWTYLINRPDDVNLFPAGANLASTGEVILWGCVCNPMRLSRRG